MATIDRPRQAVAKALAVIAPLTACTQELPHTVHEDSAGALAPTSRPASLPVTGNAVNGYLPSVQPGNLRPIGNAAVPFALYVNQIHSHLHPIFADTFLASLDRLPRSHPMNDLDLLAGLELVISGQDGSVVRRGLFHPSGVGAFDMNSLAAVDRASPFGPPPAEILSPDGNVYLYWEFRRDAMACSPLYAHPFILKAAP
ncbi:MAG TPA: hypothetical protein VHB79_07025 [Polyangiaceae bacterium]|nr:hypothetical protein [Polyangiaceae bacterium]